MGFLTKRCPTCKGAGEIHKGNRWVICPTCKGKGVV